MIRKIYYILIFSICSLTFAQTPAPVQIQPDNGAQFPAVQQMQPPALTADDTLSKAEQEAAAKRAAAEAEAQRKAANIEKFSHLLPKTEDVTEKIGLGFFETYWGHMLIALAGIAVVFYLVFKDRKKYAPTPYQIAKGRLELSDTIYKEMGAKEYAQEISQAIRDYIEAVHAIPAPERTTEEFLALAAKAPQLDAHEHGLLEKILKLSDMAKFAKHSFKIEEKDGLLHCAQDFIHYDHEKLNPKKSKNGKSSDNAAPTEGDADKIVDIDESKGTENDKK